MKRRGQARFMVSTRPRKPAATPPVRGPAARPAPAASLGLTVRVDEYDERREHIRRVRLASHVEVITTLRGTRARATLPNGHLVIAECLSDDPDVVALALDAALAGYRHIERTRARA